MALSDDLKHKQLMSSMKKMDDSLKKINDSLERATSCMENHAKLTKPFTDDKADRYKQLIVNLIEDQGKECGYWLDISGTINYLSTLNFTEEDLLELGLFTEEQIDKANEDNTSNDF